MHREQLAAHHIPSLLQHHNHTLGNRLEVRRINHQHVLEKAWERFSEMYIITGGVWKVAWIIRLGNTRKIENIIRMTVRWRNSPVPFHAPQF